MLLFYGVQYPIHMKLLMYLGNDLIEAVPVNVLDLRIPGYLGKFKRTLKLKYRELLQCSPDPPEFLVVNTELQSQNLPKVS